MKRKHLAVLVGMSFVAMLFLSGFASNAQAEGKTGDVKQGNEEKETFKKQAKEKLGELDKKINDLEVKAKEIGSKTKAEAEKGLKDLKKQHVAMKKNMERLEAASKDTWEAAKQKVNKGLDKLEKTYNKVRDYFR